MRLTEIQPLLEASEGTIDHFIFLGAVGDGGWASNELVGLVSLVGFAGVNEKLLASAQLLDRLRYLLLRNFAMARPHFSHRSPMVQLCFL